jgi:hypothetical protein
LDFAPASEKIPTSNAPSRTEDAVMPSRWVCAAIVVFWLLTNGWLLWHELLPSWEPDQPPAMSVDLVEEVQLERHNETPWTVSVYNADKKKWERSYGARTWVEHGPEKDLFDLKMKVEALPITVGDVDPAKLVARRVDSMTRVTSGGELREVSAKAFGSRSRIDYSFQLEAQVSDGEFRGSYLLKMGPLTIPGNLTPTQVNYKGTVMLGIHPLQRLRGLRPRQSWQVPTLDFVGLSSATVHRVRAHVLPDMATIAWHNKPTECQVVESGEDEEQTRTWVQPGTGLVLRQETRFMGERWGLQRER